MNTPPERPPAEMPESVRGLIKQHIVSVQQLEILLLLREHRHRAWTADEVHDRIHSSSFAVAKWLADLTRRKFLAQSGSRFRYEPTPGHDAALAELVALYPTRKHAVVEMIFDLPD